MTDPATQESYHVPDLTIVDPRQATVRNGQCAPDGFTNNHHPPAKTPSQPEGLTAGQEMKITDSVEGEGNFRHLFCFLKVIDIYEHVNVCVCVGGPWRNGRGIFSLLPLNNL